MTTRTFARSAPLVGAAALLLVGIAACGGDDPGDAGPATVTPSSGATTGPEQPPLALNDSVVVATDSSDVLSQALGTAATEGRRLQLDVVADYDPQLSDLAAGRAVLPATAALDGVRQLRVSVDDATALAEENAAAQLLRITGTFDVTAEGDAFALAALSTGSDPALLPAGADDAQRCTALEADRAPFDAAVRTLAADAAQRDELLADWGSARGLWWAVQDVAPLVAAGEAPSGDGLARVCGWS